MPDHPPAKLADRLTLAALDRDLTTAEAQIATLAQAAAEFRRERDEGRGQLARLEVRQSRIEGEVFGDDREVML